MRRLVVYWISAWAAAAPAWGQCVMCREAAASQNQAAIAALNLGILVLLIPLAAALIGMGRLLRRFAKDAPRVPRGCSAKRPPSTIVTR